MTEFELHAFVDGELAAAERRRVHEAAAASAEIRERIAELRRLKDMLRAAYPAADAPEPDVSTGGHGLLNQRQQRFR